MTSVCQTAEDTMLELSQYFCHINSTSQTNLKDIKFHLVNYEIHKFSAYFMKYELIYWK